MRLTKRLVLASRSPRRIHLLRQIGLDADVIPADTPEEIDPALSSVQNALELALRKARRVGAGVENGIVVGADTIVEIEGTLLGKPLDRGEAIRMLQMLSGRTHSVSTGIALLDRPSNRYATDVETTRVTFRSLPQEEIEEYVAGGSPMDKAGAYGIQDDYGAVFVTRIEGCFYNVMGFPLSKFHALLQEFQNQLMKR
jgi:septum formation protein